MAVGGEDGDGAVVGGGHRGAGRIERPRQIPPPRPCTADVHRGSVTRQCHMARSSWNEETAWRGPRSSLIEWHAWRPSEAPPAHADAPSVVVMVRHGAGPALRRKVPLHVMCGSEE